MHESHIHSNNPDGIVEWSHIDYSMCTDGFSPVVNMETGRVVGKIHDDDKRHPGYFLDAT
tara:strand:- start:247 stop:426 length:180 start_codon:yes stop_codon:yes gene_type:complete